MSAPADFVADSMAKVREAAAAAPPHEQMFAAMEALLECLVGAHDAPPKEAPPVATTPDPAPPAPAANDTTQPPKDAA